MLDHRPVRDPRVVDQDVDTALEVLRLGDDGAALAGVRDVEGADPDSLAFHDALLGEAPQGGAAGGEDQEVVGLREEEASEREAEP
jgi:hypothetical protein